MRLGELPVRKSGDVDCSACGDYGVNEFSGEPCGCDPKKYAIIVNLPLPPRSSTSNLPTARVIP